jgi:ribosomal protein S12 methylthiotransferase
LILIAQELTYYGLDKYKKRALGELLDALQTVDGIEWIRLHYAYPSKFPEDLFDAMVRNDKVCRYLDIPLQHASDRMLDAMKRQTTREYQLNLMKLAREKVPGIALRTTMLVGFPGETEDDVEDMIQFIEEVRFDRLGVFQYSHEEGTSGYLLEDDVPASVKQERANRLMEVQQGISLEKNLAKVGQRFKVLIDRKESGHFVGRTEFDSPEVDNEVFIDATDQYLRIGDFAEIRITDATEYDLFGVLDV